MRIEHRNVIKEIGRRGSSRTAKSAAYSRTITITARATLAGLRDEDSVKRLEAIVTKGTASLPPQGQFLFASTVAS